jgi:uncharacterized protein
MAGASLVRATLADLEVRSGGDGRTLVGLAVPFDIETEVDDGRGSYREVFRRGAFAKTVRERGQRVPLLVNHDHLRRLPIGVSTVLREDAAGLYSEYRVSQTREGDEVLALVRDGALDGLSIGFRPIKDRPGPAARGQLPLIERIEAALREVSAVAFPAYADAKLVGVRTSVPFLPSDEARRRLALASLR